MNIRFQGAVHKGCPDLFWREFEINFKFIGAVRTRPQWVAVCLRQKGHVMARKSRYMGYVEGLEQLKAKHEKRRKIEKEKSLTRKLNQYKKEVRENG